MKEHTLKVWPEMFGPLWFGLKPFEVRKDDRGFAVGDLLVLRECEVGEAWQRYSGRTVVAQVTFLLRGGAAPVAELPAGVVVMGLRELQRTVEQGDPMRGVESTLDRIERILGNHFGRD